ncbi:hypothetical protein J2TS6_42660 [Paenibacillus albilobatus]|uniref:Phage tail protein n=1 Tax=Paenibacillus albilobatus TaxID=2716884 RepID=A0A919XMH3_9BACL|nr:phage major tail tube protein [Paenibacillus albilobatus]GIO33125.1 hypothetical protein J2TS6_42660 [Paenibacillus albilobatus]
MPGKQVRDKLITYSVYRNGTEFLGTSTVELPSIEALTDTVKGAGIGGEFEMPVLGQIGSMEVKLNWNTLDPAAIILSAPESHALDFRASQQSYNTVGGILSSEGAKVSIRGFTKSNELGSLEPGSATGGATTIEASYIKITVGGKVLLEIDKFNFIFVVNGKDYLAQVRADLGL